jgi:hypothetical protein
MVLLWNPCTIGEYIFLASARPFEPGLLEHEYIHVLQWEGRSEGFGNAYLRAFGQCGCSDAGNKEEAVPYVWTYWRRYFGDRELSPWLIWRRYE